MFICDFSHNCLYSLHFAALSLPLQLLTEDEEMFKNQLLSPSGPDYKHLTGPDCFPLTSALVHSG